MRYTDAHNEAVRSKIVVAAAAALRDQGVDGVSIPAIMKRVGLTHGSFYSHFADRDELVGEAVRVAGEQTAAAVFEQPLGGVRAMLASYLSTEHRDHPSRGCVVAALGPEGARQSPPVRRAFAHVARGFIRFVGRKLHPKSAPDDLPDDALVLSAQMIGALVLSRLVDDPALSQRILLAAQRV